MQQPRSAHHHHIIPNTHAPKRVHPLNKVKFRFNKDVSVHYNCIKNKITLWTLLYIRHSYASLVRTEILAWIWNLPLTRQKKKIEYSWDLFGDGSEHSCFPVSLWTLRMHVSFWVFICVCCICLWVPTKDSSEPSFASETSPLRYGSGSRRAGGLQPEQRCSRRADRWRRTGGGRGVHLSGLLLGAFPATERAEEGGAVLRCNAGLHLQRCVWRKGPNINRPPLSFIRSIALLHSAAGRPVFRVSVRASGAERVELCNWTRPRHCGECHAVHVHRGNQGYSCKCARSVGNGWQVIIVSMYLIWFPLALYTEVCLSNAFVSV